ncbi:hypothetical protein [Streptomyces sp. NPDC089915]
MSQLPVQPLASKPAPPPLVGPNSDLLDRAQAGWERFLDTFEELPDE